jgi:hypothetical protein
MSEESKTYKTAGAFRTALEVRLQNRGRAEDTDLQRLRRQVAFDRFLARLFSKGARADYPWILKGGYAMELRTHTARTTRDIDLTLLSDGTAHAKDPKRREQVRANLQEAATAPFNDFFEFLVGEAGDDLDGAPEGGSRYPVQARMDGRDFARFHVDTIRTLLQRAVSPQSVYPPIAKRLPGCDSRELPERVSTRCQRRLL